MNNKAPLIRIEYTEWLQAFRGITRATDERTVAVHNIPQVGVGHSAALMIYEDSKGDSLRLGLGQPEQSALRLGGPPFCRRSQFELLHCQATTRVAPGGVLGESLSGSAVRRIGGAQSVGVVVYRLRPTGIRPRPGLRWATLSLGRGATPSAQVRARRYLCTHIPTGADRPGVDTGRAGSVFIVPGVETQRNAGIRRVPHTAVRPSSL